MLCLDLQLFFMSTIERIYLDSFATPLAVIFFNRGVREIKGWNTPDFHGIFAEAFTKAEEKLVDEWKFTFVITPHPLHGDSEAIHKIFSSMLRFFCHVRVPGDGKLYFTSEHFGPTTQKFLDNISPFARQVLEEMVDEIKLNWGIETH